jgi:hypothetical protein
MITRMPPTLPALVHRPLLVPDLFADLIAAAM